MRVLPTLQHTYYKTPDWESQESVDDFLSVLTYLNTSQNDYEDFLTLLPHNIEADVD